MRRKLVFSDEQTRAYFPRAIGIKKVGQSGSELASQFVMCICIAHLSFGQAVGLAAAREWLARCLPNDHSAIFGAAPPEMRR